MDDLDDFVIENSNSQLKTKKCNNTHAKVKTSEEQETLTISSKWEGSKLVEEIKKAYPCQILFQNSKIFLPDFKLPGGCHVLIIEEINYVGGQKSYKQNLTKFYKFFKSTPTVVICIRSEVTRRDFSNLQIYCVVELGLPLVPVRSIHQIPQLVHQLILKEERPGKKIARNPYKFGTTTSTESSIIQKSFDKEAESLLQKVPGLGDKKASILVKHFPTLRDLLEANQSQLSQAIGQSSASTVWNFFNPKNS